MRTQQSDVDLQAHYDEQIKFMEASSSSYDAGFKGESKRLAVVIRTLVHDTTNSKSLLSQLGKKNIGFIDTSKEYNPHNLLAHFGLVAMRMSIGGDKPGATYVPLLDDVPFGTVKTVPFAKWWNQIIFAFKRNIITRKELVLTVANQDGGAHVDPKLDDKYLELSRRNALGWTFTGPNVSKEPLKGAELASVRQIAHELLMSLKKSVPVTMKSNRNPSLTLRDVELSAVYANKIGRNDPCPCGSGKKYKRCHLITGA